MPARSDSPPPLVLGATAPVGRALLRRLAGALVHAAVRRPPVAPAAAPQVVWQTVDLYRHGPAVGAGTPVLSAGPLDALVEWLERDRPALGRVVALSSTSVHVKARSADPAERALAARLKAAEERLAGWCTARGIGWTVLRPTLIYDDGDAGALAVYVRIARRLGFVPLPRDAVGLRQPVHADDVAQAMLACLPRAATLGAAYDLPGGETLGYRRLVARTLLNAGASTRIVGMPRDLLAAGLALAQVFGAMRGFGPQMLARMAEDLCFDAGPARRDFGWAPRAYPGR